MSVDGIRKLMAQGTAVSAARADALAEVARQGSLNGPLSRLSASGQPAATAGAASQDTSFSTLLQSAVEAESRDAVGTTSTTAAAGNGQWSPSAGLVGRTAHRQTLPIQGEMWEIQMPVINEAGLPLVEAAESLAATGNAEADELTERVLQLRMGRNLEAGADIRAVASAQTLLIGLGYDVGSYGPYANGVDGVLGPKTSAALTRFQEEQGLATTGTLTAETSSRLLAQGAPALDSISASWQQAVANSPFDGSAYQGTANPYWYVRFIAEAGDDPATMDQIDPVFKGRLAALARDAGQSADIGEGFRTLERQAWFYQRYLDGTGALAAKPGQSRHNMGLAADTQSAWLQRMDEGKSLNAQTSLLAYGLCKPMADGTGAGREPWHLEPIETRA